MSRYRYRYSFTEARDTDNLYRYQQRRGHCKYSLTETAETHKYIPDCNTRYRYRYALQETADIYRDTSTERSRDRHTVDTLTWNEQIQV
jgi:hypothetical protein